MYRVVSEPIDAEAVRRAVEGPENGAVVVFFGTVRNRTGDRAVTHLEYEAYPAMAEAQMAALGAETVAAHGLSALACVHRTGRLALGEAAVVVAAAAPHRKAALDAVETYIRRLKEDVPIWKKEHFEDGAVWVGSPDDPQGRHPGEREST